MEKVSQCKRLWLWKSKIIIKSLESNVAGNKALLRFCFYPNHPDLLYAHNNPNQIKFNMRSTERTMTGKKSYHKRGWRIGSRTKWEILSLCVENFSLLSNDYIIIRARLLSCYFLIFLCMAHNTDLYVEFYILSHISDTYRIFSWNIILW